MKTLSNFISVFDTKARNEEKESSYNNLLVGILIGNAGWFVKSNIEASEGFADIIVETDDIFLYGIAFCKSDARLSLKKFGNIMQKDNFG